MLNCIFLFLYILDCVPIALISLYVIAGVFCGIFCIIGNICFEGLVWCLVCFLTAFSALVFGLYSKMLDLLYIMFRHIHRCLISKDFEHQAPYPVAYYCDKSRLEHADHSSSAKLALILVGPFLPGASSRQLSNGV